MSSASGFWRRLPERKFPGTGRREPVLPLLLIINYGSNLGTKLFLQPSDNRILLGAASAANLSSSSVRSGSCAVMLPFGLRYRCAGNNLQLHGTPENSASRSNREPPGIGA